jgi:hypothetical protein
MGMNRAFVAAGAAMVIATVVLVVAFVLLSDEQRTMLAFETAKAAVQVFPLAFFGVIVAGLVRSRDERRTREEHLDRDRRELLHDAIDAYNTTKRVRRRLRGAGFVPPSGRALTAGRLRELDSGIAALSDAQLDFERLAREVESSGWLFSCPGEVRTSLRVLEDYVNRVVREWERGRARLVPETSLDPELATWHRFTSFVASVHEDGDFATASGAMRSLEGAIRPDLLGSAASHN